MIERIKTTYQNYKKSKGRKIFFGIFYLIFFLLIFIYLSMDDSKYVENNSNQNTEINNYVDDITYKTTKLDNDYYKYKIIIQNNYDLILLEGDLNNLDSINNYEYKELFELPTIKQMIKNAKLLSKNLYTNESYKINYEISNYDLYRIMNKETQEDDNKQMLNTIVIITNQEHDVIGLEYDFSNYFHMLDENIEIYKVSIEYSYE